MAYSNQDKLEMAMRQARVDIGQGRGNALSKAVDLFGDLYPVGQNIPTDYEDMFELIFEWADKFAKFNQKSIEKDYRKWIDENYDKLRIELGLVDEVVDIEESYNPLRRQNEYPDATGMSKPKKKGIDPEEKKEYMTNNLFDAKKEDEM